MGVQLLVNPYPAGSDGGPGRQDVVSGSAVLFGSAVTTGEPINWTLMAGGIGYNEINFLGNGINGQNQAYTTGFAVSAGVCTVTANNNFFVGQAVTFQGNTQTLSALFNNVAPVIITGVSSTTFTFATTNTGTTTTGDVGIAVASTGGFVALTQTPPTITATVTALSASGTTLTVTAANKFLPGAQVQINVATGTLGPKLAGLYIPVIQSTTTAFTATMPSALTGSTGTGTATGGNPPQPLSVKFWSELASGYVYQYSSTTGALYVMQAPTSTPGALTALGAGAYPAGVLADVIKFEARFTKG